MGGGERSEASNSLRKAPRSGKANGGTGDSG